MSPAKAAATSKGTRAAGSPKAGAKKIVHKGRTTSTVKEFEVIDPFGRSSFLPATIKHLVIIRQSAKKAMSSESDGAGDELDLSQFQKMALQIVDRSDVSQLPGADLMRVSAADIVRQTPAGAELRRTLNAIPVPGIGGRIATGYLIIIENTGWLLVVDSAAKVKVSTADHRTTLTNPFTDAFCRLIDRYQIGHVYSRFDRIVRTSAMAAQVAAAGRRWGTILHTNYGDFDLGDGGPMFTQFALFTQMQYEGTVAGLTKGWHTMAQQGRWPKGGGQLPAIGYKFVSETDPQPIPDPEQQQMVLDVIEWAADPELTYKDITDRLAERYKWVSPVAASRGATGTIADLRYPATAVRNLLAVGLPLWLTGVYNFEAHVAHWLGANDLSPEVAKRIQHHEDRDKGRFVAFEIPFNHQEGATVDQATIYPGADPEKVKAAMRRLAATSTGYKASLLNGFTAAHREIGQTVLEDIEPETSNRGGKGATDAPRKPLASIGEWVEGNEQFAISARHRENYLLVRRPLTAAIGAGGARNGWHDTDRDVIGVLNAPELHAGIADAIITALEEGTDWGRGIVSDLPEADDTLIQQQVDHITYLEEVASKTEAKLDIALDAGARKKATELMVTIEQTAEQLEQARLHLARLHASISNQRLLAPGAIAHVEQIVNAMAALAETEQAAPRVLNETLRNIITDLRARLTKDGSHIEVAAQIRVATSDGDITVGPITVELLNRRRTQKDARGAQMFAAMFRDGQTLEEVAATYGYTDIKAAQRLIHKLLKDSDAIPSKGLRAAAIDCPLPEVRKVIWAAVDAKRTGSPFQVPANLDPAWAAHIYNVYTNPGAWTLTWCSDAHGPARAAVGAAQAAGDAGLLWSALTEEILPAVGFELNKVLTVELVNGKNQDRLNGPATVVPYDPVLERSDPWHRHAERRVWARRCSYCDARTLTHVLRVPEIPGGMLCTKCRHIPTLPTVTFPEDYLRNWAGPRGIGAGKSSPIRGGTREE